MGDFMKVLLIKTSSMGDLIHTLPAISDAARAIPDIQFDWVVEKNFADIPAWHPQVQRVIPVSLRQWRKHIFAKETREAIAALRDTFHEQQYDLILDAQGLVKSACLLFLVQGKRAGLDWRSARESLASLMYQQTHRVNFYQHAVVRMRQLFSSALHYDLPQTAPDFGLQARQFPQNAANTKDIVFLFGTTWTSKQWPEAYWIALAKLAEQSGYRIKLSGHGARETESAERMAAASPNIDLLPSLSIADMAAVLANAKGVVAVDTGFGHLAAALNLPTVSIYGSTNPAYTGALGSSSITLAANFPCSPCLSRTCEYKKAAVVQPACYTTITPEKVWLTLQNLMTS